MPLVARALATMRWMQLGAGVAQDYDEAIRWYTQAAEDGDLNAQTHLGVLFRVRVLAYCKRVVKTCAQDGDGVAKDIATAMMWLEKASVYSKAQCEYAKIPVADSDSVECATDVHIHEAPPK
jgi:TPR repeat protein